MHEHNTITYFVSSVNRVSGTECNDCDIIIGPVSENYDSYFCECVSFHINVTSLAANHPDTYYLVADGLAENGYKTHAPGTNSLKSDQIVLGWSNNDPNNTFSSKSGSKFIIKNLRQRRQIRFRLYNGQLQPEDGTYTQATTNWSCILLLTPIH